MGQQVTESHGKNFVGDVYLPEIAYPLPAVDPSDIRRIAVIQNDSDRLIIGAVETGMMTGPRWDVYAPVKFLDVYDAVVGPSDTKAPGFYQTLGSAIAAGCRRIFIRNGKYSETANIELPNGTGVEIIGESRDGVVIDLTVPGGSIMTAGYGASVFKDGQIRITSGSALVDKVSGVLPFTGNVFVGDYIFIGGGYHSVEQVVTPSRIRVSTTFNTTSVNLNYFVVRSNDFSRGIVIRNCSIKASDIITSVLLFYTDHVLLDNVMLFSGNTNGMLVECGGASDAVFRKCYFFNGRTHIIFGVESCYRFLLDSCLFECSSSSAFSPRRVYDSLLRGCTFAHSDRAVDISDEESELIIEGCNFLLNVEGIRLERVRSRLNVIGCGFSGNTTSIYITNYASYASISGSRFKAFPGIAQSYAIRINNGSQMSIMNNMISEAGSGIRIEGGLNSFKNKIIGNTFGSGIPAGNAIIDNGVSTIIIGNDD